VSSLGVKRRARAAGGEIRRLLVRRCKAAYLPMTSMYGQDDWTALM
jgi:hypothetical protein